jgi:hypothetical protein
MASSASETAQALGLSQSTDCNRYGGPLVCGVQLSKTRVSICSSAGRSFHASIQA